MRWPTWLLLALVLVLQYPLWLGKGGWLRVWDIERKLDWQRAVNQDKESRNGALDEEIRDLKTGTGALEERARYELGLVKEGEVFIQAPQIPSSPPPPTPATLPKRP
jgi:cell division protein FtsB